MSAGRRCAGLVMVSTVLAGCFPIPGFGRPVAADGGSSGTPGDAGGGDGGTTADGGEAVDAAVPDSGPLTYAADAGTPAGPRGGRISRLAAAADTAFLYAAGDDHGAAFVSSDTGASFTHLALPAPMTLPVLGASAGSTDVVLAADAQSRGAWISVDRGVHWAAVDTLAAVSVQRFLQDAANPAYVLAVVKGGVAVGDAGAAPGGLWRSTDNGQAFAPLGYALEDVNDVVHVTGAYVAATERGLLRLPEGGSIQSISGLPITAAVPDPSVPDAWIVADALGTVSRLEGGTTTTLAQLHGVLAGGLLVRGTEVLCAAGDTLYRGVAAGVPADAGAGRPVTAFLAAVQPAPGVQINDVMAVGGLSPGLVVASAGGGVVRVTGAPFAALAVQPAATGITRAQRCPALESTADRVVVGCVDDAPGGPVARVFEGPSLAVLSEVAGLDPPDPLPTAGGPVGVALGADGTRWVSTGTLYRAAPGGTFTATALQGVFAVAPHPSVAGRVLLGVLRPDGMPQVHLSDDDAVSSAPVRSTLGIMPWQVAWHPTQADRAWVVALPELSWRGSTPLDLERGLFETADGFQTLVPAGPDGLGNDAVVAAMVPQLLQDSLLVVTGNGRAARRDGVDGAWTDLGLINGLRVMSVVELPGRAGTLVAAGIPRTPGAPSLAWSRDGAASWAPLEAGVPPALCVRADGASADAFLVGTAGQGVWRVMATSN
ncbi:MAG: hypothetical protein HY904_23580 [Deltaproteobacteria bacterium]|nr:hypothetical protein [Deltaproteobacteria bacterium]